MSFAFYYFFWFQFLFKHLFINKQTINNFYYNKYSKSIEKNEFMFIINDINTFC